MFFNINNEENIIAVTYRALLFYKVKTTIDSVAIFLQSHPFYPSLKSICDFLNKINVVNYPLKISIEDLYLVQYNILILTP